MSSVANRYDFVLLFDVKDGNPNGDPDAGNMPRVDAETGMGLVTDVCLKRKVRNFVQMIKEGKKPFDIFIKEKAILNNLIDQAHEQEKVKIKEKGSEKTEEARKWMCENFFDIRTFGAVMSTGKNAGQVRGPVQLTFGRSIERVVTSEHSITRMAVATVAESEKQSGDNRTMGRKFTIPYGLYLSHGFISAPLAKQTGFSEEDLKLLWDALKTMFDHDRSAARGLMGTRKLIVFKHGSEFGNAPAQNLFDLVKVERATDPAKPAREFTDYKVTLEKAKVPQGVELLEML
ncbi:MAG: type I-C CRISPR-associated protein Cas7/Csd2 [Candidatus Raymondbacteria bacterium RifOxyC12_full_50_8]|uniref:Type I-C CRISPR-associated protein Cas7/Csd2 n=1 Tax=Candidatus Raymondbacteria bacterium RIFOXYD12_FULL_49_13 TaxID=1817890 RepID=A0A1F7F9W9_UNCRA|nr:MAG: type I-C CRISPR-associated protein Cas7/Csd2 [Candidatus Raymondbacteria bacterium RifOxyB12_full_50_8]OGJ93223.1 MAG: type I-C CRISPR-associated protein Cas7/Csd2 [Candidatus Raymondbacteria bacterium RIFOXYA2_FULL_49_16]OGK03306.1 MAG: type I-C CRISPR-associated protein Cas7/Csd2 [Candidatus Raymondbacteria bacterium RIFOXYD12_FULL_49_13]OGK07421.1 MAG: type I-C CRISPR-associated protein Cas7/Csd2 [Candidatus Raymondbacteria bacterium RifOxyC12_full_50_8]OGP44945.1 MAG: type I-C CRISP